MCGIDQAPHKSVWDLSNFLKEWVGLVKLSKGASGVEQAFYKSGWDQSNL